MLTNFDEVNAIHIQQPNQLKETDSDKYKVIFYASDGSPAFSIDKKRNYIPLSTEGEVVTFLLVLLTLFPKITWVIEPTFSEIRLCRLEKFVTGHREGIQSFTMITGTGYNTKDAVEFVTAFVKEQYKRS